MLSSLKKLFAPAPFQHAAHAAYAEIVAASRKPFFYQDCEIADTVDGRFDVIVLHIFLVIRRLRSEATPETDAFARLLQEAFFSDMDRALREMGASDTGIGKRMKVMAQAFYGRMQAYENNWGDDARFSESLKRNLYREASVAESVIQRIDDYAKCTASKLQAQTANNILSGKIDF